MDNKDPWVSYDKVSTSSDAFAYVQEIGNDLSDSLEHLNQGSPVRAKGLPTEKYTAGNTNDVMEGVHEESFLTQTPSKVSRRSSIREMSFIVNPLASIRLIDISLSLIDPGPILI